jgi:sphingosine-1-phosphate phosphatase 1
MIFFLDSTHAMIGFSVPFSLLYFCSQRYEVGGAVRQSSGFRPPQSHRFPIYLPVQFPFVLGLVVCTIWCILICLSRLYLGMHSVLVSHMKLASLKISFVILVILKKKLNSKKSFFLGHSWRTLFGHFALCLISPTGGYRR